MIVLLWPRYMCKLLTSIHSQWIVYAPKIHTREAIRLVLSIHGKTCHHWGTPSTTTLRNNCWSDYCFPFSTFSQHWLIFLETSLLFFLSCRRRPLLPARWTCLQPHDSELTLTAYEIFATACRTSSDKPLSFLPNNQHSDSPSHNSPLFIIA